MNEYWFKIQQRDLPESKESTDFICIEAESLPSSSMVIEEAITRFSEHCADADKMAAYYRGYYRGSIVTESSLEESYQRHLQEEETEESRIAREEQDCPFS